MQRILMVLLWALMLALPGCGRSEQEAAQMAGDTSRPLDGKSLSRKGQLQGSWMAVSDGPYGGLEFMEDSMLLTQGFASFGGRALTMNYDVLDGGRLSLIGAGGQTVVLKAVLEDDWLELTGDMGLYDAQRFLRVPSGQELQQARKDYHQKLAAEREQRLTWIRQQLSQPNLVLRSASSQVELSPTILRVSNLTGNSFAGEAVMNMGLVDPVVFKLRGQIQMAGDNSAQLLIHFNQLVDAASRPMQMQGRFGIANHADESTFKGKLHTGQGEQDVLLMADESMTEAVTAYVAAVNEQHRQALARVADLLGARAVLNGTALRTQAGEKEPLSITLERIGEQHAYQGTAVFEEDGYSTSVRSQVEVKNGRDGKVGALNLSLQNGNSWSLFAGAEGFSGTWFFGRSVMEGKSADSDLQISKHWTVEQLAAEKKAMDTYVQETLSGGRRFFGRMAHKDDVQPVQVELQSVAEGRVNGRADYPLLGLSLDLQGQVQPGSFGPRLQLQAVKARGDTSILRQYGSQQWDLELTRLNQPLFEGKVKLSYSGASLRLQPFDEQAVAADLGRIAGALADAWFLVTEGDRERSEPTYAWLKLDAATNKVTGGAYGNRSGTLRLPAYLSGELVSEMGVNMLRLTTVHSFGAHNSFELVLLADFGEKPFSLEGPVITGNRGNVRLTPLEQQPPLPEQHKLLIMAYQLGAGEFPPAQPKEGDIAYVFVTGKQRGDVYGSGPYTYTSDVGAAAVHAGLLGVGEVGLIRLNYGPLIQQYRGSDANGVSSRSYTVDPRRYKGPSYELARVDLQ